MYGVNKNTKVNDSNGVYAVPGVNQGYDFLRFVAEPASPKNADSDTVLRAYFNNGGTFDQNRTIFKVDESKVKELARSNPKKAAFKDDSIGLRKGDTITPDQAVALAYKENARQIKEILNKVFNDEEIEISGSNWKEYAKNVQHFFEANKHKITNKVDLYLVYNASDYLNPRKYNWIAKTVVNADGTFAPSTLKAEASDKLVKSTPDTETSTSNDFGTSEPANVVADTDNLPF